MFFQISTYFILIRKIHVLRFFLSCPYLLVPCEVLTFFSFFFSFFPASLGIPLKSWPNYTSNLRIELWSKGETDYFIKVWYGDQLVPLPSQPPPQNGSWLDEGPWQVKGPEVCTLREFLSIAKWSRLPRKEFSIHCNKLSLL